MRIVSHISTEVKIVVVAAAVFFPFAMPRKRTSGTSNSDETSPRKQRWVQKTTFAVSRVASR